MRVPSARRANGSKPRTSSPRSKIGVPRYGASIPSAWLPWPGKSSALAAIADSAHHRGPGVSGIRHGPGPVSNGGDGRLDVVEGPVAPVPGGEPGGAGQRFGGHHGEPAGELGGEGRAHVEALAVDGGAPVGAQA